MFDTLTGHRPCARPIDLLTGKWSVEHLHSPSKPVKNSIEGARATLVDDTTSIDPLVARYRLIIIGAVAIAQALVPMAQVAGFDVTVIDPRPAFATQERFADVDLIQSWPDTALAMLKPDQYTAVVTLTHDAKPDDMALTLAVRSPAFYVGALGSKNTHAKRIERLTNAGVTQDLLQAIHAPIGLSIGSKTPADIAVSILAQIVLAKNSV